MFLHRNHSAEKTVFTKAFRILLVLTFLNSFIIPPSALQAQILPTLPAVGTMVTTSPTYVPVLIKGIRPDPENPLQFHFIVNTGNEEADPLALREESVRLIKYFLASLTVPEEDLWVNLSPYEGNRVVPASFGQTEMAMDLLAQDYLLKQLSASLMYPEKDLGKAFWDRVYARAQKEFGTTHIPLSTFTKIWIVPNEAVVYEKDGAAYLVKSSMKVMLEEDYVALRENIGNAQYGMNVKTNDAAEEISGVSSEVIREVLIPEIEKEVNEGENFAKLRQIYQSMVLATWYKMSLKETLLGQAYADQNKVKGVDLEDSEATRTAIYDQYVEAFRKGVYEYIREEEDPLTGQFMPRRYFSGGFDAQRDAQGRTLQDNIRASRINGDGTNGAVLSQEQLALVAEGLQGPEGSMDVDLTTALVENATAAEVNSSILDDERHRLQDDMGRDIEGLVQQRVQINGKTVVAWEALTEEIKKGPAGDSEEEVKSWKKRIETIVDRINKVSIRGKVIDPTSLGRGKGVDSLARYPLSAERLAEAEEGYLEGKVVPHFNFGGGATRFVGSMYGVKITDAVKDILGQENGLTDEQKKRLRNNVEKYLDDLADKYKKENAKEWTAEQRQQALDSFKATLTKELDLFNKSGREDIPMGPRQIIAYRVFLEKLADPDGTNPEKAKKVVNQAPIIVHLNGEIFSDVIEDLKAHSFYGFNAENVYVLVDDVFQGFSLTDNGGTKFEDKSGKLPPGHGFALEQFNRVQQVWKLDSKGVLSLVIDKTLLQLLSGRETPAEVIRTQRVNDVSLWTEDVGSVKRVAFFLDKVANDGAKVGIELVANPGKQKGGTWVTENIGGGAGMSFLVETLAMRSPEYAGLYNNSGEEEWPYNAFRNLYTVTGLKQMLTNARLRKYLRVVEKDGKFYFYTEMVTGDITQLALTPNDVIAFQLNDQKDMKSDQEKPEVIRDMKAPQDLGRAMQHIAQYNEFVPKEADPTNAAVLSGDEEQAKMGQDVVDLLARMSAEGKMDFFKALREKQDEELERVVNEVNALRINGEVVKSEDLEAGQVDVVSEYKAVEARLPEARNAYLEGKITPHFNFGGAATRLGLGSMYSIEIKDVVAALLGRPNKLTEKQRASLQKKLVETFTNEKTKVFDEAGMKKYLEDLAQKYDQELKLAESDQGMGPRQIIAYRQFLEKLAQEQGKDINDVIAKTKIVVHFNDMIFEEAAKDLFANDFYGFNRENVYILTDRVFKGFSPDEQGEMHFNGNSQQLPPGHGYALEQFKVQGQVYTMDAQGVFVKVEQNLLDVLESRGVDVIRTQRVNDLTMWTEDVGSVHRLAYFMDQMDKGVAIGIELVGNPKGQKGGSYLHHKPTGKTFLAETLALKTSDLQQVLDRSGKEKWPYNAFRNWYSIKGLKEVVAEVNLPRYLRVKGDSLYTEMVTGDVTQLAAAGKVAAFRHSPQ
ncbi:MAG TPA: hypothetical protein P5246_02135, partial [Candidatus Omnitrophota bacterium]|nr:hypothetical protein [Candidatus Omnitrophota bacterium]